MSILQKCGHLHWGFCSEAPMTWVTSLTPLYYFVILHCYHTLYFLHCYYKLFLYIVIIHCIFPLYFYIVTIRQQEVGAWRTPRLLFFIFSDLQIYISCQNCKCHSHIINRETLVLPLAILITLPGGIFQHHPPLSGGGIALFPHYRDSIRKCCPLGQYFPILSLKSILSLDEHTFGDSMLVRQYTVAGRQK